MRYLPPDLFFVHSASPRDPSGTSFVKWPAFFCWRPVLNTYLFLLRTHPTPKRHGRTSPGARLTCLLRLLRLPGTARRTLCLAGRARDFAPLLFLKPCLSSSHCWFSSWVVALPRNRSPSPESPSLLRSFSLAPGSC